jgi:hypothetical protein
LHRFGSAHHGQRPAPADRLPLDHQHLDHRAGKGVVTATRASGGSEITPGTVPTGMASAACAAPA